MHRRRKRFLKGYTAHLLVRSPVLLLRRSSRLLGRHIWSLLLTIDTLLDERLKALATDMLLATPGGLLVCEEPCKHVFIGVKAALLVGHVVARARLLVQLRQTVRSLLEAVLQGDQVQLG